MQRTKRPSPAGQMILDRLKELHTGQAAFARTVGITPRFLSQMLYGWRRMPIARLEDISKALALKGSQKSAFILAAAQHAGYAGRLDRSKQRGDSGGSEPDNRAPGASRASGASRAPRRKPISALDLSAADAEEEAAARG